MPAALSDGIKKLFVEPNFAHLATLMADGSPQVTPVWVDIEGDRIIVNSSEGRTKPRNVRRDARVALSIYNQENPYSAAFIRGRVVEITHEGRRRASTSWRRSTWARTDTPTCSRGSKGLSSSSSRST